MSLKISDDLRSLLLATNLGHSRDHPLAGWNILTILYGNRASAEVPRTLGFIVDQYNFNFLDSINDENQITDAVVKNILEILEKEAKFIEVSPRKIRVRMASGAYHMQQAPVYRITSRGIEYLTVIPKVLDAESTVTANTARIEEYCELIAKLNNPYLDTSNTKLFNDFHNMMSAYSDVMKGMHKLGEDLDEVSNDLAFNHGGKVAEHLNQMLNEKAYPAYNKLISQSSLIQKLFKNDNFPDQVARSRYGSDSLEVDQAIDNQLKVSSQIQRDRNYVYDQLQILSTSFEPTSSAIDSSYDSIYIIFSTIMDSMSLLSAEYDHIRGQTVDIKQLTGQIDQLLKNYQTVAMPEQLPRHLAQDRLVINPSDLLEASTLGPVFYQANKINRRIATIEDNPDIARDDVVEKDIEKALDEFRRLVMQNSTNGRVDHDLELQSIMARDEIIRLYSAIGYDHYESFAPFGRSVKKVTALTETGPLWLHCQNEVFSVQIPSGFYFNF